MTPEPGLKEMVEENLELARENNRMLHKLRRSAFIGNILRLMWWAVIIGVPLYLYLTVLKPYLDALGVSYEGLRVQLEGLRNLPILLEEFFKNPQAPAGT
jgi:hypothetical protein